MVTVLVASRSVPPLAVSLLFLAGTLGNLVAERALSAAVSVVLPWSMCPMVPTFTWGFLRSNTPLAMVQVLQTRSQLRDPWGTRSRECPSLCETRSCHRGLNPGPPPYQGG